MNTMEQILTGYYEDNGRKLRGAVNQILSGFGGIWDKDMDDFYSLANEVFVDVMRRYEGTGSFDRFLYSCLSGLRPRSQGGTGRNDGLTGCLFPWIRLWGRGS